MSNTSITKTQKHFQDQEKTTPYAIIETDILEDENLSNAEFRVLAILLSYASKQGFCNITNTTLENKYSFLKERNFRKICKQLEDNRYICRIHHPLHKRGSMRYLVPAQHHDKFIKYILKKHHAFKYAAKIKTFFEGGEEETWEKAYRSQYSSHTILKGATPKKQIQISSTGTLSAAPSDRNVKCRSINNINIIKEEENSNRGKSVLPFFTDFGNEEVTQEWMEYISKNLRLKLPKLKKLYDTNQEYFDNCKNPRGALIAAVKGGYADEKIHKAEEKLAKEKAAIDESEKKAERRKMAHNLGKAIQRDLKRRPVEERNFSIYVDDYRAEISFRDMPTGLYFDYSKLETVNRMVDFMNKHNIKHNIKINEENKNE